MRALQPHSVSGARRMIALRPGAALAPYEIRNPAGSKMPATNVAPTIGLTTPLYAFALKLSNNLCAMATEYILGSLSRKRIQTPSSPGRARSLHGRGRAC